MLISAPEGAMMMLFCPDAPMALRTGRQTMADALPRCMAAKLDIEQGTLQDGRPSPDVWRAVCSAAIIG